MSSTASGARARTATTSASSNRASGTPPPTSTSSAAAQRKLRILCLHSFRTNAKVFETQMSMARWTSEYAETCEFVVIDAPHAQSGEAPADVVGFFGDGEYREWWNAKKRADDEAAGMEYVGLERSLETIETVCEENGPFDGLLGFSQGATLCAIALATPRIAKRFGFGVLVSGMKSRATQTRDLDYGSIACPTLHVIGKNDRVMPVVASEGLLKSMTSSETTRVAHDGGHSVPRLDEHGEPVLRKFLDAYYASVLV